MVTVPDKNNPLRRSLGELLRQVRRPSKTDNEWQKFENDLFLRLDTPAAPRPGFWLAFAIPRPALAGAAVAALVLSIAGAGVTISLVKNASGASTAGIVSVRGAVAVTWGGKGAAQTITDLAKVKTLGFARPGTTIATLDNSTAVVRLDKGSVVELLPGSRLVVKASSPSQQACFLSTGSVLVKVNKRMHGQKFEIRTPCASCRVIGTIFRVDVLGESKTTLSVYQGTVKISPLNGAKGAETFVETGKQLTVGISAEPFARLLSGAAAPIRDISVLGMLADPNAASDGLLDISSQPEGAKVLINGAMAGKAPLLVRKPRGAYSIVVCTEEYEPWDTTVVVSSDLVCEVRASLSRIASVQKPDARMPRPSAPAVHILDRRDQCETELRLMPDYIEALVDISSGQYQQALEIFDSLSNCGLVDIKARMCLMDKVNACYSKLGDFEKASEALEDRYQNAQTPQDKGQLLWEMATMRANCLGDYQGAEMALVEFLILQPNGIWAHSAYGKLAEIQYYLNKYDVAAKTYAKHIATFPDDPDIDKSMFNLACILGQDLNKNEKAARWYSRLIDLFHDSKYRAAAFFRRGECEMQMGKRAEAQRDFRSYLQLAPDGTWRETCLNNLSRIKLLQ